MEVATGVFAKCGSLRDVNLAPFPSATPLVYLRSPSYILVVAY